MKRALKTVGLGVITIIGAALIISLVTAVALVVKNKVEPTTAPVSKAQYLRVQTVYGSSATDNFRYHAKSNADLIAIFQTSLNGRLREMVDAVLPIMAPDFLSVESATIAGTTIKVIYRVFYKTPCDCMKDRTDKLFVMVKNIDIITEGDKVLSLESRSDVLLEDAIVTDDQFDEIFKNPISDWEQKYGKLYEVTVDYANTKPADAIFDNSQINDALTTALSDIPYLSDTSPVFVEYDSHNIKETSGQQIPWNLILKIFLDKKCVNCVDTLTKKFSTGIFYQIGTSKAVTLTAGIAVFKEFPEKLSHSQAIDFYRNREKLKMDQFTTAAPQEPQG